MAAEGHRKYVESLSTQARQALEKVRQMWISWKVFHQYSRLDKPMVLRDRGVPLQVQPRLQITRGCFGQLSEFLTALDGSRVSQRSLDDCVAEVIKVGGSRVILLAPFMSAKASYYGKNLKAWNGGGIKGFIMMRSRDSTTSTSCLKKVRVVNSRWNS